MLFVDDVPWLPSLIISRDRVVESRDAVDQLKFPAQGHNNEIVREDLCLFYYRTFPGHMMSKINSFFPEFLLEFERPEVTVRRPTYGTNYRYENDMLRIRSNNSV